MKRTSIFFALLALVALTIFGCQKDSALTPDSNDQQSYGNHLTTLTPQARLVMAPSTIEGLNHKLPAFNLDQFRATYRKVSIFERFEIEPEDMVYFIDDVENDGSRKTVTLPAGSVDGLADAIEEAGEGGKVIVASGTHYESARVVISEEDIKIQGQPGAVIESDVTGFMPVLHIKNTEDVKVQGIELVSTGTPGTGTVGILIEESEEVTLKNNTILGFDFSILNEEGEEAKITDNTIAGTGFGHCITNINGEDVKIQGNVLSGGVFGAWLCDEDGTYKYNTSYSNLIGVILCKVPAGEFPLPDGGTTGSDKAGEDWDVKNNNSYNNILEGYLVIDGANNNYLKNNFSSGNGTYDFELTADTYRFGFLTPASFENEVKVFNNLTVKDCGNDNEVTGGIQVDINLDPCY